jgi:hypothetical protein
MLFNKKQNILLPYVSTSYLFTHLLKIFIYLPNYLITFNLSTYTFSPT